MTTDRYARLRDMVARSQSWHGGLAAPPVFSKDPAETIYGVASGLELTELRSTPPPLRGGTDGVLIADLEPPYERSVWLSDEVPGRGTGCVVVTDKRGSSSALTASASGATTTCSTSPTTVASRRAG